MTGHRLRDLEERGLRNSKLESIHLLLDALAVALPALKAHEGDCEGCAGTGECHSGSTWKCNGCGGTGSNPARRALDTLIGGEA